MAKLYTYMIGIEPSDWDFNDTKECKKYGLTCKGYYKLGDNEGMVLVGELDNIEDIMEMYFGLEIVDECLCPIDEFDYEDGRWVTGGWTESKKFVRKSLKEGIDVKIVYSDDTPSEYIDDVTHNDILEIIEESPEVYKIFDISGSKKKLIWSDEYGFERAYESKKSMKKSLKESNQITANIWEWQKLLNGVFNFTKWITKTFVNGETLHKSLEKIYRDEEITLDEFVNACIDYIGDSQFEEKINEYVKQYLSTDDKIKNAFKTKGIKVVESKKFTRKSMKESVDGYIATDEDCNMSGKGWVLDGSYNFIMEFLQEWGIAPKDVKVKNGMTTLYNAEGNPFGYVYQDEEVDIFVADKTINWTWENHNPSTKRVKVTALDEIF